MRKILIVDDQSFNQALIAAYIHQYCDQTGEEIKISTANNGTEAVVVCEHESYDLIFMDILMPVMNGIEATKIIHSIQPNAIIVIVSTQEDEENQIQALRNGAKDYFVKPIQPDIFKHRLQLYINIMNNDKIHSLAKQSINPFTNAIYCYKTTYLIEDEENLAQLWESMMATIKNNVRTNLLSDLIRFMYQLGQLMLSHQVEPEIIMEENEESYFFSITNVDVLPVTKITQLIEDHLKNPKHEFFANLLSFEVTKEYAPLPPVSVQNIVEEKTVQPFVEEPKTAADTSYYKRTETLQTFNFMEEEDIASLELRLNELSTQFLWMGSNELNEDDVDNIVNAFERTSSIMMLYSETQTLGSAIRDLSSIIQKDEKVFIEMASQMSALCKSFNNDLMLWCRTIFYEGAPSVNYMDASIISNIQMVQSFLKPPEEISLNNDDGFEFF